MLPKRKKRHQPVIKLPSVDVNKLNMYFSRGNSQMTIFSLDLKIEITRIKKVFQNAKRPSKKDDDLRSAKDRYPELELSIDSETHVVMAKHKSNGNIGNLLQELLSKKQLLINDTLPMIDDKVLQQVEAIQNQYPTIATIDLIRCILNKDDKRLAELTKSDEHISQNTSAISTMCTIYAEPQLGVIIKPNQCTVDNVMTELSDKFDLIEDLFLVHHDPKEDSISLVYKGPQELNAIDTFLMYFSPDQANFFVISKNELNKVSLSQPQPMTLFTHGSSEMLSNRDMGQVKRKVDPNSEPEENQSIRKYKSV